MPQRQFGADEILSPAARAMLVITWSDMMPPRDHQGTSAFMALPRNTQTPNQLQQQEQVQQ